MHQWQDRDKTRQDMNEWMNDVFIYHIIFAKLHIWKCKSAINN